MAPCRPAVVDLAAVHAVEAFDSQIAVLLAGQQSGGEISALHITAEPKSGPPLHLHQRADELVYVLSGSLAFYCDGRRWTGGAGTLAYLPKGVPHTWANLSEKHGRLLVVCSPGGLEDYLTEVARHGLQPGREGDGDAIAALGERHDVKLLGPNPLLHRAQSDAPGSAAAASVHAV